MEIQETGLSQSLSQGDNLDSNATEILSHSSLHPPSQSSSVAFVEAKGVQPPVETQRQFTKETVQKQRKNTGGESSSNKAEAGSSATIKNAEVEEILQVPFEYIRNILCKYQERIKDFEEEKRNNSNGNSLHGTKPNLCVATDQNGTNEECAVLKHKLSDAEKSLIEKERSIVELATKFEELNNNYESLQKECQATREAATGREESESTLTSSSFQVLNSFQANSEEPLSLPSNLNSTNDSTAISIRIRELEKELKASKLTVKKLKDMNIQWQLYDRQREENAKKLQEKLDQMNREVTQLNAQINTESTSSISFTPAQQEYIDGFYQRIRRDADRFRDQRDATVQDAQQNISAAKRRQEEAEKKALDQRKRADDLEAQLNTQQTTVEELRTALVVATRNQQPEDAEAITSLREAARQYEEDYKRVCEDYERVLEEKRRLEQRLRQQTPTVVRQTIVNHPGGRTTTVHRTNRNVTISNENYQDDALYDDIEIDS